MSDMLVSLLSVKPCPELKAKLEEQGIVIRRAMTPDMYRIFPWIEQHSSLSAKGEAATCFSRQPVSLFIATKQADIIGYACYEATCRNFFGPTKVLEEYQGMGIGKALLIEALLDMRSIGYAYAIIGGVGPKDFYRKCAGAIEIPDSTPGIYKDFLGGMQKK